MTGRRAPDLSVYFVTGPDDTRGRPVVEVVLEAVRGGVTIVQLRWKHAPGRAFVQQARALIDALRPVGVPLIVNDRVDVALASGADGVHVGQDDIAPADVRQLVGERCIVGLSVTNVDQACVVDPRVVDYVGLGPVFATASKEDAAPPLGLDGTRAACRALAVPAVAIGGVSADTAAAVIDTGVDGIAVVSAIGAADDPHRAAVRLTSIVRDAAHRRWRVHGTASVGGS